LTGLQKYLADEVLRLRPESLGRGNETYGTMIRALKDVTLEIERPARAEADKPKPVERVSDETLDRDQKAIDEWRRRLARRKKLAG
jgi:hypothetical protein